MKSDNFEKYEIHDFISLAEKKKRRHFKYFVIANIVVLAILLSIMFGI